MEEISILYIFKCFLSESIIKTQRSFCIQVTFRFDTVEVKNRHAVIGSPVGIEPMLHLQQELTTSSMVEDGDIFPIPTRMTFHFTFVPIRPTIAAAYHDCVFKI